MPELSLFPTAPPTQPTLHLTNWSSRKLHHGRVLTIMANPRQWEHGAGRVPACMPSPRALMQVQSGYIGVAEYRAEFVDRLSRQQLEPGKLAAIVAGDFVAVESGDTLCCACSRAEAAAGRCHRVWAAEALRAAGWAVVLDGVPQ